MLRTENLTCELHGRRLLSPLNLSFKPGRLHAIFGPNGAGKSTLLKLLAREWSPSAGRIVLDELPLQAWTPAALAHRRAMLPQQHALSFPFSAREVVELGRLHAERQTPAQERAIASDALAACGASALASRSYSQLSGGERARVQLARVLAQIWQSPQGQARYLLLDEPTAHLDLAFQHACLRLARDWLPQQVCVIAVLHDPNLVLSYADEVIVLAEGQLHAHGAPVDVMTGELMRDVYGLAADRLQTASGGHWLAVHSGI